MALSCCKGFQSGTEPHHDLHRGSEAARTVARYRHAYAHCSLACSAKLDSSANREILQPYWDIDRRIEWAPGPGHDGTVAAGPVGSVAGSKCIFAGDELAPCAPRGDAESKHRLFTEYLPVSTTRHSGWPGRFKFQPTEEMLSGQGQRHAGIVGPFPGLQAVWPTAPIPGHRERSYLDCLNSTADPRHHQRRGRSDVPRRSRS